MLVNRDVADMPGTVIWSGYNSGSALAIQHLIEIGRRRIAYLGLDTDNAIDRNRFLGYRQTLEAAGLTFDPSLAIRGANDFQGGYDAMEHLTLRGVVVDAVFAFNDLMAIGAMRFALTHGIDVPRQLALVGFGGSDLSNMVTPALTTVSVPLYTIGVTAFQELLDLIAGGPQERRQIDVPPRLIVRGSTVLESHPAELAGRD